MKRTVGLVTMGAAGTLMLEVAMYIWAVRRTALRWFGG